MPQLSSGRRVGVLPRNLIENVTQGTDTSVYAFVVAYRLSVQKPEHLRELLPVVYYKQDQDDWRSTLPLRSEFLVKDVFAGKADWTQAEIDEFKIWLDADKPLHDWLVKNFKAIDDAIRNSIIWQLEFVTDEPEEGTRH